MSVSIALDTSTRTPSIAVRSRGLLVERSLQPERSHASDLLPALEQALSELEARPAEIELVAVGLGPGSFTGLRVGIATARGLARSTGAGLIGLPSGEIIAQRRLEAGQEALHIQDARGGTFYVSHFARDAAGQVRSVAPARLALPDELGEILSALPAAQLWADQGALQLLEQRAWREASLCDPRPQASCLLEIAEKRAQTADWTPSTELEPLYLRPFAARARRR